MIRINLSLPAHEIKRIKKNANERGHYARHCEERLAYQAEYARVNRDRILAAKLVYNEAHREEQRAWHKTPEARHKHNERQKKRYRDNREALLEYQKKLVADRTPEARKKISRRSVLRKYDLTTAQYEEMLAAQNGVCTICEQPPNEMALCVDHDHVTNKVRALLCRSCNIRAGWVDHPLLQKTLDYLARYK